MGSAGVGAAGEEDHLDDAEAAGPDEIMTETETPASFADWRLRQPSYAPCPTSCVTFDGLVGYPLADSALASEESKRAVIGRLHRGCISVRYHVLHRLYTGRGKFSSTHVMLVNVLQT